MTQITEYIAEDSKGNELDWVKVEGQKRFNITRRDWTQEKNLSIDPGETYVVPRNADGMKFYFRTNEYFKILDTDPDIEIEGTESANMHECRDCGRSFSSPSGLKQHRTKTHEEDKNEEGEE